MLLGGTARQWLGGDIGGVVHAGDMNHANAAGDDMLVDLIEVKALCLLASDGWPRLSMSKHTRLSVLMVTVPVLQSSSLKTMKYMAALRTAGAMAISWGDPD